nr:hypothetical protein [Tanacetum cinerariifolium]
KSPIAIAPVLPTKDPDNTLSMGDEHLSTIPETKSDEVIKSSVENLVSIPSESEGIFDDTCDVSFCDNSPPLDVLTDHFELFFDFIHDYTLSDDDYFEDLDYVEASPPDSELVSLEEHAQPEDIQELLRKLLEDLQIIREELVEYINSPSWNHPSFYDDDDGEYSIRVSEFLKKSPIAIAPVLPTKDPDNTLSMGDEHLSTIPETKSDEVIKSSVENLVSIPSESEGIFDDTCDVSFCDNSPPLDVLTDHFELFFDFIHDYTLSDDDYFEDLDYVEASPPDSELVSLEEVQDDILLEKLLNINLLIAKIESLNDNSTPDCVIKSPSPFHIPVKDSDFIFETFDTSLSYSDKSLPEFETFSDHTEETSTGSTTTHADNSLPEYDSFHFEIEPDQGKLSNVGIDGILGELRVYVPNILPTHPTLMLDLDFIPSDDSFGFGPEISFPFETRNKIFDPRIFFEVQSKRFLSRDSFSLTYVAYTLRIAIIFPSHMLSKLFFLISRGISFSSLLWE